MVTLINDKILLPFGLNFSIDFRCPGKFWNGHLSIGKGKKSGHSIALAC